METVIVIEQHDVDSMNGFAVFRALATDVTAAKRWIQDEVDGKHKAGHRYMQGKDADWWIQYGTFSLKETQVH
jgi:hypothetical protein